MDVRCMAVHDRVWGRAARRGQPLGVGRAVPLGRFRRLGVGRVEVLEQDRFARQQLVLGHAAEAAELVHVRLDRLCVPQVRPRAEEGGGRDDERRELQHLIHVVGHVDEELGVLEEGLRLFAGVVHDNRELFKCCVRRDSVQLPVQHSQRLQLCLLELRLREEAMCHLAEVVEARHLDLGELRGEQCARERHYLHAVLRERPSRRR
mmetsp:Transcript_30308/g.77248  ORF Transcript_30308/g.77248 Transcript_30308/m.77248 type:complete len:206 (-) Transcript_30308:260-877(-)